MADDTLTQREYWTQAGQALGRQFTSADRQSLIQWDPNTSEALKDNRDWSGISAIGLDPEIFNKLQADKRAEFFAQFEGAEALGLDASVFDQIPSQGIKDEEMLRSEPWLKASEVLYRAMNPYDQIPPAEELASWAENQVSIFNNGNDTEANINFGTGDARASIEYLRALNDRTETNISDRWRGFKRMTVMGLWSEIRDPSEGIADATMYDRETAFGQQYLTAAKIMFEEKNGPGSWKKHVAEHKAALQEAAEHNGWFDNQKKDQAAWDEWNDPETAAAAEDKLLADWAKSESVWHENNIISQRMRNGGQILWGLKTFEGESKEYQQALAVVSGLNGFTESRWGEFGSVMGASLADPAQIAAGVGIGAATVVAVAAAPVVGTAGAIIGGATVVIGTGAAEGYVSAGMLNTGVQYLRLNAGVQAGGFDYAEHSSAKTQGAIAGAAAAPFFAAGGVAGKFIVRKTVQASGLDNVISSALSRASTRPSATASVEAPTGANPATPAAAVDNTVAGVQANPGAFMGALKRVGARLRTFAAEEDGALNLNFFRGKRYRPRSAARSVSVIDFSHNLGKAWKTALDKLATTSARPFSDVKADVVTQLNNTISELETALSRIDADGSVKPLEDGKFNRSNYAAFDSMSGIQIKGVEAYITRLKNLRDTEIAGWTDYADANAFRSDILTKTSDVPKHFNEFKYHDYLYASQLRPDKDVAVYIQQYLEIDIAFGENAFAGLAERTFLNGTPSLNPENGANKNILELFRKYGGKETEAGYHEAHADALFQAYRQNAKTFESLDYALSEVSESAPKDFAQSNPMRSFETKIMPLLKDQFVSAGRATKAADGTVTFTDAHAKAFVDRVQWEYENIWPKNKLASRFKGPLASFLRVDEWFKHRDGKIFTDRLDRRRIQAEDQVPNMRDSYKTLINQRTADWTTYNQPKSEGAVGTKTKRFFNHFLHGMVLDYEKSYSGETGKYNSPATFDRHYKGFGEDGKPTGTWLKGWLSWGIRRGISGYRIATLDAVPALVRSIPNGAFGGKGVYAHSNVARWGAHAANVGLWGGLWYASGLVGPWGIAYGGTSAAANAAGVDVPSIGFGGGSTETTTNDDSEEPVVTIDPSDQRQGLILQWLDTNRATLPNLPSNWNPRNYVSRRDNDYMNSIVVRAAELWQGNSTKYPFPTNKTDNNFRALWDDAKQEIDREGRARRIRAQLVETYIVHFGVSEGATAKSISESTNLHFEKVLGYLVSDTANINAIAPQLLDFSLSSWPSSNEKQHFVARVEKYEAGINERPSRVKAATDAIIADLIAANATLDKDNLPENINEALNRAAQDLAEARDNEKNFYTVSFLSNDDGKALRTSFYTKTLNALNKEIEARKTARARLEAAKDGVTAWLAVNGNDAYKALTDEQKQTFIDDVAGKVANLKDTSDSFLTPDALKNPDTAVKRGSDDTTLGAIWADQLKTLDDPETIQKLQKEREEAKAARLEAAKDGLTAWLESNATDGYNALNNRGKKAFVDDIAKQTAELKDESGKPLTPDALKNPDTTVLLNDGRTPTLAEIWTDAVGELSTPEGRKKYERGGIGSPIGPDADLSLTWAEAKQSTANWFNVMTDHDGDGDGFFVDTNIGRSISGGVQSAWRAASGAYKNSSQTRQGKEIWNGIFAFGGALFAPWALSKLPGFGWLNARGVRTVVIFAAFFLGWKALNSGALTNKGSSDSTGSDRQRNDTDRLNTVKRRWPDGTVTDAAYTHDETEGSGDETAQGSGQFAIAAKAVPGVKIQNHEGGMPKVMEFDFDEDGNIDLTLRDDDKDGVFVAQVADVNSADSYVLPEMINSNNFSSSTKFAPTSSGFEISDATTGQEISIEIIDEAGQQKKSVFTVNGNAFELPIVPEADIDAKVAEMETVNHGLT